MDTLALDPMATLMRIFSTVNVVTLVIGFMLTVYISMWFVDVISTYMIMLLKAVVFLVVFFVALYVGGYMDDALWAIAGVSVWLKQMTGK